ncbi:MAG: hypothetical protein ACLTSO_09300 [Coprococcus sp.]
MIFVGGADDMTIDAGQNIHIIPGIFDTWRADKGHWNIFSEPKSLYVWKLPSWRP